MRHVLLLVVLLAGCVGHSREKAESEANTWARQMGIKVEGVSCTDLDTDADGYVTCTVNRGDGQLVDLQCAAVDTYNTGCKPTQPKARVRVSY